MTRLILISLLSLRCFGAIAPDNYHVGGDNGGTGSVSWNHTNGCVSNCVGYVTLSTITVPPPSITITWGGVAMTPVTSHARSYGDNGPGSFFVYCIVAPASGSATIAATAAGWLLGNSVTFSGAKQTCTPDATGFTEGAGTCTTVVAVGFACPVTITPVASNVYLLAMFSGNSSTMALNINPGPPATGTYRNTTDMYTDYFVWDSGGAVSGPQTFYAGSSVNGINYSAMIVSIAPFNPYRQTGKALGFGH